VELREILFNTTGTIVHNRKTHKKINSEGGKILFEINN
jgi:hypothetical protein